MASMRSTPMSMMRVPGWGDGGVIDGATGLRGVLVAGEDGDLGGVLAVGNGDAGVGGGGEDGADAGDDFEREFCLGQRLGFLRHDRIRRGRRP